eukprot:TRINITY_DN9593_c0_g1_i1.p1 TRINITY_DN9593_c0_g1~~TRINITY_DN9593_c0_g1_i1.p1  ORF type:complete len:272 (+),score=46.17 TRINITY_DN9593_c0_g1_i1:147-962(+)
MEEDGPGQASMTATDRFFQKTAKHEKGPSWSLRTKPEMVVGGGVPSWTKTVPGPKYNYDINTVKPRPPSFSIGQKTEMVIGGDIPSWKASIPGPYNFDAGCGKPRQPCFSMGGRSASTSRVASKTHGGDKSPLVQSALRLTDGFKQIHKRSPSWSVTSRTEFVSGGDVPSWKKSIPGPYTCDPDVVKRKQPVYSIGRKLPTESDIAKKRSPGPIYEGAACNATKQAEVDSTKKTPFAPSFGRAPPRFEGKVAKMAAAGALARYDRPVIRRR